MSGDPYLEIAFQPTVTTINEARRLVLSLFGPLLGSEDLAGRAALATHELLENALKYSSDGSTVIRVELSHASRTSTLTVETRNLVSDVRRAGLDEAFAEMRTFASAHGYYQHTMRRTRSLRDRSGLGLARIWAEGEMTLTHEYANGNEARIKAALAVEVPR